MGTIQIKKQAMQASTQAFQTRLSMLADLGVPFATGSEQLCWFQGAGDAPQDTACKETLPVGLHLGL